VISFTNGSRALYIKSISVTYEDDGGDTPQPTTYSITGTGAVTGGNVTASATSGITAGTNVTITATPSTGYDLSNLTVDGNDVTSSVNSSYQYTFTMPEHDVAVSATFTEQSTPQPSGSNRFERITNVNQLEAGKRYLLVDETKPAVLGEISTGNTTYGLSEEGTFTLANDVVSLNANSGAKILTLGGQAAEWTFQLDDKYLSWTGGNSLSAASTVSENTQWIINIANNGEATIRNVNNNERYLRYNYNSPRFACYAYSNNTLTGRNCYLYVEEETGNLTITCAENIEHGSIEASQSTANEDDLITITATPEAGYELSTVTVIPENGTAFQATVSDNTATFNMPSSNVTVTATFSLRTLNITRTIKTNGNVSSAGGWVGSWGSNCTVGTDWETNPEYIVTTTVGKEVTFMVGTNSNYQILQGNVTAVDEDGNPVTLTSTWRPNEQGQISFSFIMPGGDVAITANFTNYRGTLRLAGHFNGNTTWRTGEAGPAFTYNSGNDTYTIKAYFTGIDDSGANDYFFLTLDGKEKHPQADQGNYYIYDLNGGSMPFNLSGGSSNNFGCAPGLFDIEINGALTSMKFTKVTPSISFNPPAGEIEGGISVSATSNIETHVSAVKAIDSDAVGDVTVGVNTNNGDTWNASVTLNDGIGQTVYGKAWLSNNSDINATGSATYDVATHYPITCTANPTKGGTVKAKIGDNVVTQALADDNIKLEVSPKAGYKISSVTLNDAALTAVDEVYSFTMPAEAANVVATFTAKTLHLTINNENSKGTVYGVPATSTVGSEISFNVTPKDGYAVNTVTYSFTPTGGTENTTTLTAPYSFNMPGYDVTIDITYTEQSSGSGGDATDLYHESFGNNPNSARTWDDSYSVKTGVEDVYSGITGYTVSNVKQGKNTTGYIESGLNQSSSGTDASIIIGPLNVANYTDLVLSYYWKAASINGTYTTNLYYATSADGTYTEVEGTGNGATSFVKRTYNLPETAQVSTLYLKIVYNTSNTQAIIDEVNLAGVPNGVQAPVFTPTQGIYGIDVDVTISCPTSGATIYYTDDESDPKTSTTRKEYTGEIVISETTTFKAYAEKNGLSSDVVIATYTINKNTEIETVTLDYIETFTGSDGIGKFTIINESGYSPIWSLDGNYGVKGTAYNPNTTPTNNAATSRLVSPIIDLSAANLPELTFSHQINSYFNNPSAQCQVFIRETTDGTSGTWEQLPVTVTVPASGSWSNDFARIDLSNYIDKKIQISFLYTNPEAGSGAGTWEIQNFKVADNTDIVIVNNIAEFMDINKVSQGEKAKFRNPVVVLYHYQQYYNDEQGDYDNDYIWIKDDSGYAIVYGHYLDVEYVNGDVIPAGFTATKNYYATGGFYQLYEPEGLQPATEKALADPEPVTLAKLNENKDAYNGHYVTISKMQIQFNKGKLVAWSNSSSGQRDFSVGDETLAIENNQAGTSDAIKGYNNFDNPWLETLNYPDYQDKSTVYGDFNITAIFEQYNGTWEFMPIIITPWEPNKMTLHDLCEKGVTTEGQNEYIISNNLMCVYSYYDETLDTDILWVKDDNGQSIHMVSPVAPYTENFAIEFEDLKDGNGNVVIPANTRLEQQYYDQSNWCQLILTGKNGKDFEGKIIKGGAISGKFTDKLNPTMTGVTLTQDDIYSNGSYAPNYYIPASFVGSQSCNTDMYGEEGHGNFFFMTPKPQEYATIVWAIWDGEKMNMPTRQEGNSHDLFGEFSINLSMNQSHVTAIPKGAYSFHAIIRKVNTAGAPALKGRGDILNDQSASYMVYPLDIDPDNNPSTDINTVDVNGKAVKSVKYVNMAGVVSDAPFQGVNIVVTEYTDGSRTTSKMLRK